MQSYKVTAAKVTFGPGTVLRLKKEQYDARSHNLEPIEKNIYTVEAPVEFKSGEVIGLEGDVNKAQLELVQKVKSKKVQKAKDNTDNTGKQPAAGV